MSGLCRSDAFEVIAAQLDGGAYAVDVCDLAATERVSVAFAGDGLAVEVHVDVCSFHAERIGDLDGFVEARQLATASP